MLDGVLKVIEKLKVKNVIISKQGEISENFKKFEEIIQEKKTKLIIVNKGDKLHIEKDFYIDIIWPNNSNFISENILNNNSIVCQIRYKKFSMLFTGDIEEIAENEILKEYKEGRLKSDILKVCHHGSKSSSTKAFIEAVSPKIAMIGVGLNNKFGHPNQTVLKRLEKINCKVYRTDIMGEICCTVDKKGNIFRITKYADY